MIRLCKVGILIIGFLIVNYGCDNNPIEVSPLNSKFIQRANFTLSPNSFSLQDSVFIGNSQILYSGHISSNKISSIVIALNSNNFQLLDICSSTDEITSIDSINISLYSLDDLVSVTGEDTLWHMDPLSLNISYASGVSWFEEEPLLILNEILESSQIEENLSWSIDASFSQRILNISLADSSKLLESCNNQNNYLIIEYKPNFTDSHEYLNFLQFYSSDYYVSQRPQLSIDYRKSESATISQKLFSIQSIESLLLEPSANIITNSDSESWSRIYIHNVLEELEMSLDSALVTYNLEYSSNPVIDSSMLYQDIELLELTIKLNEQTIDSVSQFNFSIFDNSIVGYSSDLDLSGDNFSLDSLGSEGNYKYDLGENFLDYGTDQCPDQYEIGSGGCLVAVSDFDTTEINCLIDTDLEINDICVYNSLGTESNGILDWEDLPDIDGIYNNLWDEGEGEKWSDFGLDGCIDEYEDGNGGCLNGISEDYFYGQDPNSDNYNLDPSNDDYSEINNLGTENNGIWEQGELFFDIGCDLIPQVIDADGTQGNGEYDQCEPFNDTGIDGLFSYQEIGYNPLGTENNYFFDFEEPFDDFGTDGIQNGFVGDTESDDYNIDPNDDNSSSDGNGILDWTDFDNNGTYEFSNVNFEEGEYVYDFGVDGIIDTNEFFYQSNLLNFGTGTSEGLNDYSVVKNSNSSSYYNAPDISNHDAVIWVSEVTPIDYETFKIKFSIHSKKEVKSLSFSLTHNELSLTDTIEVDESFSSNAYTTKFINDISLYDIDSMDDSANISVNYANGISSIIDFFETTGTNQSLSTFIVENSNILLSSEHTRLVLPIDKTNSNIDEYGTELVLYGITSDEYEPLTGPIYISNNDHSVIIPMDIILQRYVNKQFINYNSFKLSLNGSRYNFSNIIFDTNAYIEVLYSK